MSRFAYEPNEKLIHGHAPQIRTARDLLQHLDVTGADFVSQSRAVERWLQSHEADELLTASLSQHGLPTKGRTVVQSVSTGVAVYPTVTASRNRGHVAMFARPWLLGSVREQA